MKNHFLQEELSNEIDCAIYCLNKAIISIINNDPDTAFYYIENAARSVKAISQLKKKKEELEEVKKLLNQLSQKGVNIISIIRSEMI